jgi:PAS domain S-box-containing protein
MHSSENPIQQLVDLSPDGIVVIAEEGSIKHANPAFEQLVDDAAPAGKSIYQMMDSAERGRAKLFFGEIIEGNPAETLLTVMLLRQSGSTIPVEIAAGTCVWSGEPCTELVVRDVTERRTAEAQLRDNIEFDAKRQLLRHFLATMAYRTQKALRGAPDDFGDFRVAPGVRSPHQLLHHMSGVLRYAYSHFEPLDTRQPMRETFSAEIQAFHDVLEGLSRHLDQGTPLAGSTAERLLQGPLADVTTHAGQLAMLRRLAGSPVPPENFHDADVSPNNLNPDQPSPASPDAEWLDAEGLR